MTTALYEPLRGADDPRVLVWPDGMVDSVGPEVVEWGRTCGMYPLRWQELGLELICAKSQRAAWAATEIMIGAPRQNGKGLIYEVRALAGLFLFGEKRILYSAHRLDTAMEFYRRVTETIKNHDDLRKRVKGMRQAHGELEIETHTGQILRIMSRMTSAGRGMSPEILLLDEAQIFRPGAARSLLPSQSAKGSKIQRIYMGTPPEPDAADLGEAFKARRDRGRAGDGKRFGYAEWSAGQEWPMDPELQLAICEDRAGWARANPAMGPEDESFLIMEETVEDELKAFRNDLYGFARERLWMWPSGSGNGLFSEPEWSQFYDAFARLSARKVIALDMGPDRMWVRAAVAAPDAVDPARVHVQYMGQFRPGELRRQLGERLPVHKPDRLLIDAASPIAAYREVVGEICSQAGISFTVTNTTEHVEACGLMYDAIKGFTESRDGPLMKLSHIGQEELMLAFTNMTKRKLGDRFAFAALGGGDISAGIAATIAAWSVINTPQRRSAYEDDGVFRV